MSKERYNNFFYEKDERAHKKGEERKNVNLRISISDLIDDVEERNRIGIDNSLKYTFHVIRYVIVDSELYEIELLKLKENKWYVYSILHVIEFDGEYATPSEYEEISLEQFKNSSSYQLNLFGVEDYE